MNKKDLSSNKEKVTKKINALKTVNQQEITKVKKIQELFQRIKIL